jgi:hypothetical protein
MSTVAYSSTRVHRHVGLHYLLGYALRHPKYCGQWIVPLTRLLDKGVRDG